MPLPLEVQVRSAAGAVGWSVCVLPSTSAYITQELEHSIAHFHGMEDSILYAAAFDANAGIFEVLLGKEDAVIRCAARTGHVCSVHSLCQHNTMYSYAQRRAEPRVHH